MPVSPDDRFAGLINSSAERGGWVPGDVFGSDNEGEEEPVEPRRVRLPILVALAVVTIAVLVIAFLVLRPATEHAASEENVGPSESGVPSRDDKVPGPTESEAAAVPSTTSGEIVVHVTGEVHRPSVVKLSAGSRVHDAVESAGGLKRQADAEAINLARVLQDGEQIHVPARGEESDPTQAESSGGASGASGPGSAGASGAEAPGRTGAESAPGAKIDINTADLTTLQTLPGVGPVTAEAIIAHRESQLFVGVEDLLLVQGIGPKTYESLKDLVTVG